MSKLFIGTSGWNYPHWASLAKSHKGKDIFAFFNNDAYGYAVKNAMRFRELLE